MANIIIKGKTNLGRTRSEQEINLRKEWGGTITDEQLDKMRHLERKIEEQTGSKANFLKPQQVDQVK